MKSAVLASSAVNQANIPNEDLYIWRYARGVGQRTLQMDSDAEIAQINRELAILRERYSAYARSSRMLRVVFWIWFPIVVVLVIAVIVKVLLQDALMGIFVAGGVAIICLFIWLIGSSRTFRWIDIASMQWAPFSLDASVPSGYHERRSDAQLIEDQIAEREQRLSDLVPS